MTELCHVLLYLQHVPLFSITELASQHCEQLAICMCGRPADLSLTGSFDAKAHDWAPENPVGREHVSSVALTLMEC